jgi:hypothetical protein
MSSRWQENCVSFFRWKAGGGKEKAIHLYRRGASRDVKKPCSCAAARPPDKDIK